MGDFVVSGGEITDEGMLTRLKLTIPEYFDRAAPDFENATFMIDAVTEEQLTFVDLRIKSQNLATYLKSCGYGNGDVIGICGENSINFAIVCLGVFRSGCTLTCINHGYTEGELKHVLSISKPKMIFCSSNRLRDNFLQLTRTCCPYLREIWDWSSPDFVAPLKNRSPYRLPPRNGLEDVAVILYSSGTTGYPKGVAVTHSNVIFILETIRPGNVLEFPGKVTIAFLPMFHAFGMFVNLLAIIMGHTLIVMRKFELQQYLSCVEKYKVKYLYAVPPILVQLVKSPLANNYDLSSVERVFCGAASLNAETEELVANRLPGLTRIQQMYGMTECTLLSTTNHSDKSACVGKLCRGIRGKIVDVESGRPLGPFGRGEICLQGPHVMKGYYGNEEETSKTIDPDGWLHTGDVGYYDNDGDFFIVDRIKELIKYNAYQIAPAELESILLSHESVEDAAVIGIPDASAGELPRAYVVPKEHSDISGEQLMKFVSERVSVQKRLRGGVVFLEEIPKSPSGKILRRKLRQRCSKSKL